MISNTVLDRNTYSIEIRTPWCFSSVLSIIKVKIHMIVTYTYPLSCWPSVKLNYASVGHEIKILKMKNQSCIGFSCHFVVSLENLFKKCSSDKNDFQVGYKYFTLWIFLKLMEKVSLCYFRAVYCLINSVSCIYSTKTVPCGFWFSVIAWIEIRTACVSCIYCWTFFLFSAYNGRKQV